MNEGYRYFEYGRLWLKKERDLQIHTNGQMKGKHVKGHTRLIWQEQLPIWRLCIMQLWIITHPWSPCRRFRWPLHHRRRRRPPLDSVGTRGHPSRICRTVSSRHETTSLLFISWSGAMSRSSFDHSGELSPNLMSSSSQFSNFRTISQSKNLG